jgi:integrase
MRRSELLGLRWDDIDLNMATISVNRGLVAVAYELHESRGKPATLAGPSTSTRPPSRC